MNNVKIMFIDIDGTLRNDEDKITMFTKETLLKAKENGIICVLCSGRSRLYTKDISIGANASRYIIASDGADVYDIANEKSIFLNNIDTKVVLEFLRYSIKYDIAMTVDTEEGQYTNNKNNKSKSAIFTDNLEEIINRFKIIHLHLFDTDEKKMKILLDKARKLPDVKFGGDDLYLSKGIYYLFVAKENSHKGIGIKNLLSYLEIDKSETIGFGDEVNDLKMFEQVEYKVAMENAVDKLKEKATSIAKSNNEDGVANFIMEHIL